jgi:hypothetical protein
MFSNRNEMQKIYITENKIWREEIIKYIKTKTNRNYYLDLIENNNFIIRIYDRTDYKREQYFLHQIITNHPNIARIFMMIQQRDLPLINNKRKELIDIEKKYEKNIKNISFDKNTLIDFLKQMIYCQINLFACHGVTHNNIHCGNIFVENNDSELSFNYSSDESYHVYFNNVIYYRKINKSVVSNNRYILSDFTKGRIFSPNYTSGINLLDGYDISLLKNLEDTIKLGKKLFGSLAIDDNVSIEIKEKYNKLMRENYGNEHRNYDNLNKETIKMCWEYVEPILNKIGL